jgi:DNA-binding SARP family transcriptional activator
MSSDVEVKLLGPLDVRVAGEAIQFEGSKQRTLFTALALNAPEPVSVDALVETLWGDDRPATRSGSRRRRSTRAASRC